MQATEITGVKDQQSARGTLEPNAQPVSKYFYEELCISRSACHNQYMMFRSSSRNHRRTKCRYVKFLATKLSELHLKPWMLVSVWEVPCGRAVCEVLWCQMHKRSEPNAKYWQVECMRLLQSTSHWKGSNGNDWMLWNSNGSQCTRSWKQRHLK